MPIYYFWLAIFFCAAYLILTDKSVAQYYLLIIQLARINYEKLKWWVIYNPSNPVVKWLMWRKALKLARELKKELEVK
jgi:hypothetical protein